MRAQQVDMRFSLSRRVLLQAIEWHLIEDVGELKILSPDSLFGLERNALPAKSLMIVFFGDYPSLLIAQMANRFKDRETIVYHLSIHIPFWRIGKRYILYKMEQIDGRPFRKRLFDGRF